MAQQHLPIGARRRVLCLALAGLGVLAPGSTTTGGEAPSLGGEAGFLIGLVAPDENVAGEVSATVDPTIGLRGGSVFARRWIWYIDALYAEFETGNGLGDVRTYTGRTGVEVLFKPRSRLRWFLTGGLGYLSVDYRDTAGDFGRPLVSGGFGQRLGLGQRAQFRWELRGDVAVNDSGLGGEDVGQGLLLAGFLWGPPGVEHDGDRDGVSDRRDLCPSTAFGATVDSRGCPQDSDSDSVPDGVDQCSATPAGTPVNESGCPRDSDGDGVPDLSDACPDTPAGSVVDDWGCPRDADGDGVPDGLDECPRTPAGAAVDASGCTVDGDGDGVPDGLDRCPDTAADVSVREDGCVDATYEFDPGRGVLVLWLGFEAGSAVIGDAGETVLDRVVSILRDSDFDFEVRGHVDSTESGSDPEALSASRAQAVKDHLVSLGIEASRLRVRGYGSTKPIAGETTDSDRRRNRRVELTRTE